MVAYSGGGSVATLRHAESPDPNTAVSIIHTSAQISQTMLAMLTIEMSRQLPLHFYRRSLQTSGQGLKAASDF